MTGPLKRDIVNKCLVLKELNYTEFVDMASQ